MQISPTQPEGGLAAASNSTHPSAKAPPSPGSLYPTSPWPPPSGSSWPHVSQPLSSVSLVDLLPVDGLRAGERKMRGRFLPSWTKAWAPVGAQLSQDVENRRTPSGSSRCAADRRAVSVEGSPSVCAADPEIKRGISFLHTHMLHISKSACCNYVTKRCCTENTKKVKVQGCRRPIFLSYQ